MRNVVYAINISADGCCDHTLANPDDEVLDYFTGLSREADVLLYGRKTYELMIPYWPESLKNPEGQTRGEIDFAQAFVSVPRIVVFSTTLSESAEANTTIIRGNVREEMLKLKQGTGKNILVGGVQFPSELLELGLIDEMHLVIHPVVAVKGRRLFETSNFADKLQLKLVNSHLFKSGVVALHYSR